MGTSDYLTQLQQDREDLVDNLETKGITGLTGDETFTELVPEVLNISGGGGADLNDYFELAPTTISTVATWAKDNFIKGNAITNLTLTIPSGVTSLNGLFYEWLYPSVPKVVCGNNVTDMGYMYTYNNYASANNTITSIDTSGLNTTNVTSMYRMFAGLKGLTELDLSNFTVKTGLDARGMFNSCTNLMKIDMRNFEFTRADSTVQMFGSTNDTYVPANCLIIVKDTTQKNWFTTNFSRLTNVMTVSEYEASL